MRRCDSISIPQSTSFSWRLSVKSALEKDRYIVMGFQTDTDGDQAKNRSMFDHVDVNNMYIMVNLTRYRAVGWNLSFTKNQVIQAYGDIALLRSKF